ncbi:zinc finger CCCH domain-containing protein 30-like isoform X2 [Andrographis paniculata]|uniref:zinc finger CCCH domain-containing protein 30-like isoform X2 n=1 Tax=Andrographis paniculata TaxID=175694 RepID=UPI0021E71BFA|nr:zinc finger CCCH domain-containing protein 30-like isoform X2 [Andrographis paniculata]
MCSGPEQSKSNSSTTQGAAIKETNSMKDLNKFSTEIEDNLSTLLEFAANNDAEAFRRSIELDLSAVDVAGLWYVHKKGSRQITQDERTPLMIAATYGSMDVLKLIVALPEVDLNRSCGRDKWTALHCAAFGGPINAVDIVKLLLSAGADPNIEDASGKRPVDLITVHPKLPGAKAALEDLLTNSISDLQVSLSRSNASSPVLSSSPPESRSPCSPTERLSSPTAPKFGDTSVNFGSEKKQYPVDPSLPDIRNSIYSTDEFRMFSFKVRPCSRAYSHDWTECPFVHPGENARRRDPRKYHYSCVPCPDFRKGACRRGDMCEYAHGVFECWLHPAQYRTRLCKDGTSCARQVCFFAHTQEELRPLYVSTGSGVPSPRSAASAPNFMDMAAALSLLPGSPTSQSVISPAFNQAMSPTANGMTHPSAAWPQPNVPTLHLPGSNFQSSRLRSSISARDIPPDDLNTMRGDYDTQQLLLSESACFLQPRPNSSVLNGSIRPKATLTPSNLDELFSAEMALSPRHVEHPMLQASFGVSSPRMSPRSMDPASPMSAHIPAFAQRERQQQHMRSLSSRDLGSNRAPMVGSPTAAAAAAAAWPKWESPNGKVDWSVAGDSQGRMKRSCSFKNKNDEEEPDLSWVQSLVKESPPEMMDKTAAPSSGASATPSGECLRSNTQIDSVDHSVLGAWLEQMQLDQLVV